jgi:hypothetical protein
MTEARDLRVGDVAVINLRHFRMEKVAPPDVLSGTVQVQAIGPDAERWQLWFHVGQLVLVLRTTDSNDNRRAWTRRKEAQNR